MDKNNFSTMQFFDPKKELKNKIQEISIKTGIKKHKLLERLIKAGLKEVEKDLSK